MPKWCHCCNKYIQEPDGSEMSKYAAFWRDNRCYYCGRILYSIESNPRKRESSNGIRPDSHNSENLRFEYEKRQRKIQLLQSKISQLQIELNRERDDWNEEYNKYASCGNLQHFDASGYRNGTNFINDQINELSSQINQLEKEMAEIERKLEDL